MGTALNAKQRLFVAEYLKDLNATQAAIRAGYSKTTAHSQGPRLLEHDGVRAAIEDAKAKREKRVLVDADYIVTAAKEVAERCMTREPVLERQGREIVQATEQMRCDCDDPNCKGTRTVGLWKFDSNGANGALKLLASHVHGFAAPTRLEATGKNGEPIAVRLVQYGGGKK